MCMKAFIVLLANAFAVTSAMVCNVVDMGAKGDNLTDNAKLI